MLNVKIILLYFIAMVVSTSSFATTNQADTTANHTKEVLFYGMKSYSPYYHSFRVNNNESNYFNLNVNGKVIGQAYYYFSSRLQWYLGWKMYVNQDIRINDNNYSFISSRIKYIKLADVGNIVITSTADKNVWYHSNATKDDFWAFDAIGVVDHFYWPTIDAEVTVVDRRGNKVAAMLQPF